MMSESTGNSAEHQSRRAFTRIFFDAETVVIQGEHIWPVQLVDISLRGVLIRILPDQFLRDSEQLDVSIHLGGGTEICMQVRIVNQHGDLVGLACEHIDVDSMTHLRRLVELNVGDTTLLERELHALA
jgi:hypothetical protein